MLQHDSLHLKPQLRYRVSVGPMYKPRNPIEIDTKTCLSLHKKAMF